MKLRSVHLVCFLVLLAALGVANPASCSAQEVTMRSRGNLPRRTASLACLETNSTSLRTIDRTVSFVPLPAFGIPEIDRTGNLPATRCVELQAFTSSLR